MKTNQSDPVPLSGEETAQVAELLSRLPRGYLPQPIFYQVARLVTVPTMEVLPVRLNSEGECEFLLTQRPDDDPYWPSGWHMPGTVVRSTDAENSMETGFDRVLRDELGMALRFIGTPTMVGLKFWDTLRGRELDQMHYVEVEVTDESAVPGRFYRLQDVPDNTLDHHKVMLPEIVAHYMKTKSS